MPLSKDSKGRSVVPLVINDSPLPIDSDKIQPVINSKTGETVHYYACADEETCDKACEAAWTAFSKPKDGWKRASVTKRRDLLLKVADLFEQRKEDLIKVQMLETSCEEFWAVNNVMTSVGYIREIAACISGIRGIVLDFDFCPYVPIDDCLTTMPRVQHERLGDVFFTTSRE